jgi:hypothetical protein
VVHLYVVSLGLPAELVAGCCAETRGSRASTAATMFLLESMLLLTSLKA